MDRRGIALAGRRRQALEALEFERARAAALQERLESIVLELDGPAVDEVVFARMTAEDVDVVRPALGGDEPVVEETFDIALDDDEEDQTAWLEDEIVRLQEEIKSSGRRQHAFERYLDALGSD